MDQWKHRKIKKSESAFDKAITTRFYLLGAGFVLAFTALAKIIALVRPAPGYAVQLMHFDPIVFFLSAQTLLWFAVLLELAVCGIVCFHTSRIVRHYALALLGSLFVSYQLGLWLGNFPHSCFCLGGSLEWLGISLDAMRIIAFLLLLYIWLPSGAVLARWLWKRKQRNASFGKGKTPGNVLFLLAIALSSALPNSQAAETFQLEGKLTLTGFDYADPEKIIHSQTNFF